MVLSLLLVNIVELTGRMSDIDFGSEQIANPFGLDDAVNEESSKSSTVKRYLRHQ